MGQEVDFREKLAELWNNLDPKATVGVLPVDKLKDLESFCHEAAGNLIEDNPDIFAVIMADPTDSEGAREAKREKLTMLLVVALAAGFAMGHKWVSEYWTLWEGRDAD